MKWGVRRPRRVAACNVSRNEVRRELGKPAGASGLWEFEFVLLLLFCFLRTGSCYVAQIGLKLEILVPQPPEGYRYTLSHRVQFELTRAMENRGMTLYPLQQNGERVSKHWWNANATKKLCSARNGTVVVRFMHSSVCDSDWETSGNVMRRTCDLMGVGSQWDKKFLISEPDASGSHLYPSYSGGRD
jgi:hypothetical protein